MPKPVYEQEDVRVLWNQAVHTDREVTANRPDIIVKTDRKNMHIDRWGRNAMQGSGKESAIQECMYRDTMNVEPEM